MLAPTVYYSGAGDRGATVVVVDSSRETGYAPMAHAQSMRIGGGGS